MKPNPFYTRLQRARSKAFDKLSRAQLRVSVCRVNLSNAEAAFVKQRCQCQELNRQIDQYENDSSNGMIFIKSASHAFDMKHALEKQP